jgi:hypothetical protein
MATAPSARLDPDDAALERMSPSASDAFRFANAPVDSVNLLAGIMHSHDGYSEPLQLLQHFGLEAGDLEWPGGSMPARASVSTASSALQPDAQRILAGAYKLVNEVRTDGIVHLPDLFGAILEDQNNQAYQLLARALDGLVDLRDIRGAYRDFLKDTTGIFYSDFLVLSLMPTLLVRPKLVQAIVDLLNRLDPNTGLAEIQVVGEPAFGGCEAAIQAASVFTAKRQPPLGLTFRRYSSTPGTLAIPPGIVLVYDLENADPATVKVPPGLTVLVTTVPYSERSMLQVYAAPLDVEEASELLRASLRVERVDSEATTILQQLTEGVTAALETLARAIRETGRPPLTLARRLRELYAELDPPPPAGILPRDQKDLVPSPGKLRVLCLLPEYDEDIAHELLDDFDAFADGIAWIDAGLVQRTGTRYSIDPAARAALLSPQPPFPPSVGTLAVARARAARILLRQRGLSVYTRGLAGFEADDTGGEDRLEFELDVEPLCEILAAQSTNLPISVGLFGEWGTGKSFFMRMMRESIAERSSMARAANMRSEPTAFCAGIRQITFNAWSYVDANLWASLVTHIFERLAKSSDDDEEVRAQEEQEQLRKLAENLHTAQLLKNEADARKEAAEGARTAAEAELKATEKKRLDVGDLFDAAVRNPDAVAGALATVDPELKKDLDKIGEDPRVLEQVQELATVFGDRTLGLARAQDLVKRGARAEFWDELKRQWLFFSAGLVLLIAAAVVSRTVLENGALVASGIATLTAFAGFAVLAKPVWVVWARLMKIRSTARELRAARRRVIQARVAQLTAEQVRLQQAAQDADRQVRETDQEIKEIVSGRGVLRFIQQRAGSTDYQAYLGVIALVKRDFERLSMGLKRNRRSRENGVKEQENGVEGIDRIILYIDDLDRCPTEKVVQVLEAVHLLLAYDCFAVVVGVDPRWLQTSLQSRWSDQLFEDGRWTATPENYLEKIFQLPITLPQMTDAGFGRLLSGLAERTPASSADAGGGSVAPPDDGPPGETQVRGGTSPPPELSGDRRAEQQPADGAQQRVTRRARRRLAAAAPRFDPNPEGLTLTPLELTHLTSHGAIVSTPRAAKRLFNTYRLIRASLSPAELKEFVGTETAPGFCQLVVALLGYMIAKPAAASQLFSNARAGRDLRDNCHPPDSLLRLMASVSVTRRDELIQRVARYSFSIPGTSPEAGPPIQ